MRVEEEVSSRFPISESIYCSGDGHEHGNNGKYYSHKYEDGHDKKEEGDEGKYNYGSEFRVGNSVWRLFISGSFSQARASSFQMP